MKKFLIKNGLTPVVVGLILHWMLVASLAQTTRPNNYYLSPSGSDSYSCAQATSEATPRGNHQQCDNLFAPRRNTLIIIKDGTYIAQNQLAGIPSGISWTAPVTIEPWVLAVAPTSGRCDLPWRLARHTCKFHWT
jgi:hypothetical protein